MSLIHSLLILRACTSLGRFEPSHHKLMGPYASDFPHTNNFLNPRTVDHSDQVTRQQEIRDTFPHVVLMPTIATYQLPLHQLRLDQQRMQVF